MIGKPENKTKPLKYKNRVCIRCEKSYLSHVNKSKICLKCDKRYKNSTDPFWNSLFSQIEAREQEKIGNLNRYAIVDSKNEVIEKFRNRNTAKSFLSNLKHDNYGEIKIIELQGR